MDFAAGFPDRIAVNGVGLETRWFGPGPAVAPTLVLLHEGLKQRGVACSFIPGLAMAVRMQIRRRAP
jgi:hypothetical protein